MISILFHFSCFNFSCQFHFFAAIICMLGLCCIVAIAIEMVMNTYPESEWKKKLSFQLSEWRSGQKEGDRSWEVCFVPASWCVCVWQVKGTRLPIEQVAYNTVNMYSAAKCLICRACRRSRSAMQEESVCPYLLLLRRFVFSLREDGSREKKHVSCVRLTFYACKCHIVVVYGVFLLLPCVLTSSYFMAAFILISCVWLCVCEREHEIIYSSIYRCNCIAEAAAIAQIKHNSIKSILLSIDKAHVRWCVCRFSSFIFAPPWNKIFQFNSANEKWIRISTTVKQVTCDVCVMCAFCIKSNKMQPKKTHNKIIGRWIFK